MDGAIHPAHSRAAHKYQHPDKTADGAIRAKVPMTQLETLWVNTGTLCNVECAHCYIESSPTNDRLAYLTLEEFLPFLDEAAAMGAREIGFTGGEPFMNPDATSMIEATLKNGFRALVLTNAMRPMMRPKIQEQLRTLNAAYSSQLTLRVSLDHYTREEHDKERGSGSFSAGMTGLKWLTDNQFNITVAGRGLSGETEYDLRAGFATLFKKETLPLDAHAAEHLVLFPEMDETRNAPEITEACWEIVGKKPSDVMCATSRMLVKRKGATAPVVLSCTLLPYDEQFEMGATLAEAAQPVKLNHPYCAQFCVLGGASCSG